MLEELAKKDKRWREVAINICKCKDLADEIVNQMYLRIYDLNPDKEKLSEWYIITTLRNLFLSHCKQVKHISIETLYYLPDEQTDSTFSDEELELLLIANNKLKWWEKQLLIESWDKSLRQIEKDFNINYQFVRRHTKEARNKVLDYKPKQNKNGKRSA